MKTVYEVKTRSGSVYMVSHDEDTDRYFLYANNVPNLYSPKMPDQEFEIAKPDPFPPEKGVQLFFRPIGGKLDQDFIWRRTSAVIKVKVNGVREMWED